MKGIDARSHHGHLRRFQRSGELVGERRLARSAGTVHRYERAAVTTNLRNNVGDALEQGRSCGTDDRVRVSIETGRHPTSMHADPAVGDEAAVGSGEQ
jgi:hypothetical protein